MTNVCIQLRNDTAANWTAANPVLCQSEMGVENDTHKLKIGDGVTAWNDLEYFGMSEAAVSALISAQEDNYYTVVRNADETDDAAITRALDGATAGKGDICTIKTALGTTPETYSYMGYVYDGTTWGAMDGNVSADNVVMADDITLAGNYTSVGNVQLSAGTLSAKGKTLGKLFESIFTKELNPTKPTPTCGITLTGAGAKEVGSSFTPAYTTSFDPKKYAYNPTATGVTATAWSVKDTNNVTKTGATGSFDAFTVLDNTNYKLTATCSYSNGVVPKTNLGNDYPAAQIKAGTCTASSGAVTGYRQWYIYIGTDMTSAIATDFIRSATGKGTGKSASTQSNVTIPAGTKRVMVAIPAGSGYTKTLKNVIDVDGMGLDVIGNFTKTAPTVTNYTDDAGMKYNVWTAENANGMAATRYTFTIG